MKKVSLVMITKNEERKIVRCLESAKDSVDEIILVDTGSTDKTVEYASKSGAVVYDFPWCQDFSAARNFALSKASGDWILVMDADEYLQTNAKEAIQQFISSSDKIGRVEIVSTFDDNGLVQETSSRISRLFPKGITYIGKIHEQLDTNLPRYDVSVHILHDGYFQTNKSERNIPLLLEELKNQPTDSYYLCQIAKEYKGIEDYPTSIHYFEEAIAHLTYNETYVPIILVEYLNTLIKANEYEKALAFIEKQEEFLSFYPDFYFAKGVLFMNYFSAKPNATLEEIQMVEKAYLTCLELGEIDFVERMKGTGSFLASFNLGLLYELFGVLDSAVHFYRLSSNDGFAPATIRLQNLSMQ